LQQECEVSEAMLSDAPYARIQAFDWRRRSARVEEGGRGEHHWQQIVFGIAPSGRACSDSTSARLPTPDVGGISTLRELEGRTERKTPILFGISKDLDGVSLWSTPNGVSTAAFSYYYYFKGQKDGHHEQLNIGFTLIELLVVISFNSNSGDDVSTETFKSQFDVRKKSFCRDSEPTGGVFCF